ncbi:MAG: hypothetical protein ACI8XC_002424 [Gammaproteobacteria bacterium]
MTDPGFIFATSIELFDANFFSIAPGVTLILSSKEVNRFGTIFSSLPSERLVVHLGGCFDPANREVKKASGNK